MWQCTVVVLGFSLPQHRQRAPPVGRRLQIINDEPCKSSCDSGDNEQCDGQDSTGAYTLSCDLHPTTSCDADCTYGPPPPLSPWLENGTYPAPPPAAPPPADLRMVWVGVVLLSVGLLLLVCACFYAALRRRRAGTPEGDGLAYWCWCLVPCVTARRNSDARGEANLAAEWRAARVIEAEAVSSGAGGGFKQTPMLALPSLASQQ